MQPGHSDPIFQPFSAATTLLTQQVTRGVMRHLTAHNFACIGEFSFKNGRRADVFGVDTKGRFCLVEVKTAVADFRGDLKWPDYMEYCDEFYFAVHVDFPQDVFEETFAHEARPGLIVADAFGAEVIKPAVPLSLHASRRKALTLDFARCSAQRLHTLTDPSV